VRISGCDCSHQRGGLSALPDDEVVHALSLIEELARATQSVMLEVVAEVEVRRIADTAP
jgi:hypothetical protein